jgi:hypothetical protein
LPRIVSLHQLHSLGFSGRRYLDTKWNGKQANNLQALSARKAIFESNIDAEHHSDLVLVRLREEVHKEAKRIGQNVKGHLVGFDSQEVGQLHLNVLTAVVEGTMLLKTSSKFLSSFIGFIMTNL